MKKIKILIKDLQEFLLMEYSLTASEAKKKKIKILLNRIKETEDN